MRDNELKYALEHGIIDENAIRLRVQEMKERELLDANHIWQGKDGYWRGYISDQSKPKGRRMVKKKNREDLIKVLKAIQDPQDTLLSLFPLWIEFKSLHTNSSASIFRIMASWRKFYLPNKELINKPIKEMNKIYLDKWVHNLIQTNNFDKKQYYNVSLIIRQIFEYACDEGILTDNEFAKVKVSAKMFRRDKKKKGITEVYQTGEREMLEADMMRRFKVKPNDTAPLCVLLGFEMGARIGELVSLKKSDIEGNYLHIQRQEVRRFEKQGEFKMAFSGYETVEYTKSDDGDREIYLTERARELIDLILETNRKYGNHCEDYIFVVGNQKINHYAVQARILRGCKAIGIPTKTMHKVRKTYISTLIDNGVNIDEIRRIVGHSDERTTYANYCFNRATKTETEEQIERALSHANQGDY